ncbi:MAG: dihydroneopterin aldolase [Bacteroidales bacterium]|nr:dihydroneopterin aldolase [Bacteroidales bacterium]
MDTIFIEDMRFYACHGCFEEEQTIGTWFRADMELGVDTSKAQRSDNIDDTVNYQLVYRVVQHEMQTPSCLLEHVARRIIDSVFDGFPSVEKVKLKLTKCNPPLGGKIGGVGVLLERERVK